MFPSLPAGVRQGLRQQERAAGSHGELPQGRVLHVRLHAVWPEVCPGGLREETHEGGPWAGVGRACSMSRIGWPLLNELDDEIFILKFSTSWCNYAFKK